MMVAKLVGEASSLMAVWDEMKSSVDDLTIAVPNLDATDDRKTNNFQAKQARGS